MKKILGVSLVAMMAVTTARAEIASKAYVDSGAGTYISASNTAGQNIKALDTQLGTTTSKVGSAAITAKGSDGTTAAADLAAAVNAIDSRLETVTGTAGTAVQSVTTGTTGVGTITVDDTEVTVHGLGTAAGADVSTDGVASDEGGLVSGDQVYDYVAGLNLGTTYQAKSDSTVASNGNYIQAGSDVKANLGLLDTNLKSTADKVGSAAITAKGSDGTTAAADLAAAVNAIDSRLETVTGTAGSAVQSVTTGTTGVGTITVDGTEVTVHGLGDAAGQNVTSTYSSTGTAPINGTGVADALGTLDYTGTATAGQVVTAITQADGVITNVTTADPLSVTNYAVGADGKYALTAVVSGGAITGYKWELISRTGSENLPNSGY